MKKLHSENDITNISAGIHLGKKSEGSTEYDPTLLVAVPRQPNREHYGINSGNPPFIGFDIWHAYEFSVLTESGLPVTKLLKLRYNCNNDYIVESKSLKLYLNSYNMTKIGKTRNECLNICKSMIERDLSQILQTKADVNFIPPETKRTEIFGQFKSLADFVDEKQINFNKFKEAPEVLKTSSCGEVKEHYLMFDSLRSNCRVTHQPDFGDVFIYYKSKIHIEELSLAEYLVSFRSEYHFHEECCEMIYKRLYDLLDAKDELFVCALYTRRGGIDISPVRKSPDCIIDDSEILGDITKFARYGVQQ